MIKQMKLLGLSAGLGLLLTTVLSGCQKAVPMEDPETKPVVITIWNYYNGAQKDSFDKLVREFNETVGREQQIIVDAVSKGTVAELEEALYSSADREVGSDPLPQAAGSYADAAYELNRRELLVDLTRYLSQEELDAYVDSYLDEGRLESGTVKLFPVAKASELLTVNMTDWEPFARENQFTEADFATWEGIAAMSEQYYQWSGGKAMFGRDAFANYIQVGSRQLGHEIFQVKDGRMTLDFDQEAMRRLWDNYYVPYIHGYYAAFGKFRSDDMRTGDLIAFVGSTSGSAYIPAAVTREDGVSYEITCHQFPLPNFSGAGKSAVQQGAGMVVFKSDERQEQATVQFLKWFTDNQQNLEFSLSSGYLPVKKSANTEDGLDAFIAAEGMAVAPGVLESLRIVMMQVREYDMYTPRPFEHSSAARALLDSMSVKAAEDRRQVLARLEAGMSLEDAAAEFSTGECFAAWYDNTLEKMKQLGE